MQVKAQQGDTFKSLGMRYTIGGSKYAIAIARQNGYSDNAKAPIAGQEIEIPDAWLKDAWKGVTAIDVTGGDEKLVARTDQYGLVPVETQKKASNWLLYAAIAAVVVLVLTGDKSGK